MSLNFPLGFIPFWVVQMVFRIDVVKKVDLSDFCSGDRGFGGNLTDLDRLPTGMVSLKEIVHTLPSSYLIATGVFHLLGE